MITWRPHLVTFGNGFGNEVELASYPVPAGEGAQGQLPETARCRLAAFALRSKT